MNDAALERDIERALAVDPSPEFVARARTRIADEPALSSRRSGWLFAGVATTAVAAASVVALVTLRPDHRTVPDSRVLISRSLPSSQLVPTVSRGLNRSRTTRTTNLEPHTSEPLFDPRETMALQRLIADVRDARVDLTPLLKEAPMALQPLDDLVIAPITIEPLVPGGVEGERP
jgi:hypothetical protein